MLPPTRAASELPPTRVPPSETIQYRVQRGSLSGDGLLDWRTDTQQYQLRLEASVPLLGTIFAQASQGGFDNAGLAPTRHTERRIGRSERALTFVRRSSGQGDHVAFSTRPETTPVRPGMQDRVSWMVQLPALLAALPAGAHIGQQLDIDVAGVQSDVQTWHFAVTEAPAPGEAGLIKLVRQNNGLYDTRAEVWADPRRHHWLVRVRLQESRGDPLELIARPAAP